MNVLSLFDGISVARQALHSANIPVAHYYCCEIDKYAIEVSMKNWKDNFSSGACGVSPLNSVVLMISYLISY